MTLARVTRTFASATDLVDVAGAVCLLSQEVYGIHTCIVSIHDADGRPLHTVDNAHDVDDDHRRAYFDELWPHDPVLLFLRIAGNQAAESPEKIRIARGVGFMNCLVHTSLVALQCAHGLLGVIRFRHDRRISEPLRNDLVTLGTAASIRLTELNFTSWPNPVVALLTPRQLDVARCAADGLRNAEIAEFLGLSENTVKKHLKDAFEQLGVDNRTELAAVIQRAGPRDDHPAGITRRGALTITRAPA